MTTEPIPVRPADPERPAITVVIPVYGDAPKLARLLASIADARVPALRCVHVVENGGRGPVEGICRPFADRLPLAFQSIPESGVNRAFQAALPEAGNDLMVFFGDDVRLAPNLLQLYVERALPLGPGHYFGGTVEIDYEGEPPPDWLGRHLPLSVVGFRPKPTDVHFLGANSGVFAADVRRVGGFDPNFGPGAIRAGTEGNPTGSETQLQRQLHAAGVVPVAIPDAVIWHWVPAAHCTPEWALHRSRRVGMSKALYQLPPGRTWGGVPPWALRQLLETLPGLVLSVFSTSPRERFERRQRFVRTLGLVQGARLRRRLNTRPA